MLPPVTAELVVGVGVSGVRATLGGTSDGTATGVTGATDGVGVAAGVAGNNCQASNPSATMTTRVPPIRTPRTPLRRGPGPAGPDGPDGLGVGEHFPALAGLGAAYMQQQISAWQAGKRPPGPLQLMSTVAQKITPEDIKAVAAYYAQLYSGTAASAAPASAPAASAASTALAADAGAAPPTPAAAAAATAQAQRTPSTQGKP